MSECTAICRREPSNGQAVDRTGRKPTARELNERVELVADLLATGQRKSQIKQQVRDLAERQGYPPPSGRTVEGYFARARSRLLEVLDTTRDEQRARSLSVYSSVLTSPNASHLAKIKAQTRIDRLLGLESPIRIEAEQVPSRREEYRIATEDLSLEQLRALSSLRDNLPPRSEE